jgi:hypothetical protein
MPKIYRVYFENNMPWFAEFYSSDVLQIHPVGILGKKVFYDCAYDFLLVEAENEDEALMKAKKDAERNLTLEVPS